MSTACVRKPILRLSFLLFFSSSSFCFCLKHCTQHMQQLVIDRRLSSCPTLALQQPLDQNLTERHPPHTPATTRFMMDLPPLLPRRKRPARDLRIPNGFLPETELTKAQLLAELEAELTKVELLFSWPQDMDTSTTAKDKGGEQERTKRKSVDTTEEEGENQTELYNWNSSSSSNKRRKNEALLPF